jgi:hypothetical protein
MPLPLIAAAIGLGAGRALLGATQAKKTQKRNRGLIEQAYASGHERLDTQQADARQVANEGLIARGLAGGGAVRDAGTVAPGATVDLSGAHDLAGQAVLDQRREQAMAQTELRQQRDNALTENRAAGTQGVIGSILGGVQTGMDAYGALSSLGALRGGGKPVPTTPTMATTPTQAGIPGWGGVDVVDPLGRGLWARSPSGAPTTGVFNVFNPREGMGSY